jgi:hypothetical protein
MDEHLPQMETIYSGYCSNFPQATKFYTEITRIAPYRRTGRDLCSTPRPYTTLNRTNGTLNREIATSSMSLRASVRHSKLFESPLKLIKNVTERTPSRKSEKLAVPKKIRRRHSVHFRDHDDSSSLSDSSSSSDEKPPENPNATPTRRPVKKSLSSHDCHGISSLQVEFLNSCLKKSTLNPGLPLPAHLLEPVQRVMRYTILLKTLRNHLIDKIQAEKGENCPEDKRIISLDLTIEKSKKLAYATNYYQNNETKNSQSPAPDKNHNVHLRVKNKATDEEKKSRRRSFERFKNAAENFLRGR